MMASTVSEEVSHRLCPWVLAIWVIFGLWSVVQTEHLPPNTNNDTEICRSIDIRNSGEKFESLKNCTVVEGYVQILLFDNTNTSLFENISFPKLKEITGYLLLYRVSGLVSLGQLFPNLAVIRGQPPLLLGHSLIIFEMPSLQEINLYSLTNIMKGLIRIDKNPQLCFVDTINWGQILNVTDGHFIKSVKNEDECPVCPINNTSGQPCTFCWNHQNCQKLCPNCTGACNNKMECCDENCLGGCSASTSICDVCKNYVLRVGNKDKCVVECPTADKEKGLYPYLGRRCLSKEECINLPKYVEISNTNINQEYSYKLHEDTCIAKCPPKYMEENSTCVPCAGRCTKVCPGISIDNLESARSLTGCTHIKGSLEIEVRAGENIVKGLKEHLNMIEEIDGYLKIVRSFPLISLNFFENLKVIRGNILDSEKYSFIVLDNQNLQEIWDWNNGTRKLEIKNGKLFFHFNPKLCYERITDLQNNTIPEPNFTDMEVARNSNGDKTACDLKPLIVQLEVKGSTSVQMWWPPFNIIDSRKLLSYQVYYKEAPSENVTLYDSRDACDQDGWSIQDIEIPRNHYNVQKIQATLQGLKPFMGYAFYVKTYTIAQERTGARSDIRYFVTNPDQPSDPTSIRLSSNSSDSIIATWQPPAKPNGNLTHYKVTVILRKRPLQGNKYDCLEKHPHKIGLLTTAKPSVDPPVVQSNNTCLCSEGNHQMGMRFFADEREKESQINFENDLQNRVYIKQSTAAKQNPTKKSRRRRQLFPMANDTNANGSSNVNGSYIAVYNVVGRSIYITNLKHYTEYDVAVQACRAVLPNNGDFHNACSNQSTSLQTIRTKPKSDADNIILKPKLVRQTENSITISWKSPLDPNGEINVYMIEFRKQDSGPGDRCQSHKQFVNGSNQYTIENLDAGNYSIRVQAFTDSGSGAYTVPIIVIIEETSKSTSLTIAVTVIIVVIIVALAGVYVARKFKRQESPRMNPSINPEYSYIPDDWEIPRKQIELHKELGQGSFGMVYEGIARELKGKAQMRCAIKTVNEHATNGERANFLKEASVMKAFDTSHVIKLLGVVSQGQPTLVIMELMANGDLKSYLRSHRPDTDGYTHGIIRQPPSLKRILQMAIEIADGMAYLSAKKFVHRDLAARNCMVAEDLTVKIGDFGMTRDIYETDYYRKGTKGLLPVRWMAPESLKDGVFSSSSDVWSYGVVLWEMATLASQPYQGLSNDQVLRHVIGGGIMMTPENCPDKLYTLMIKCWKYKYIERPSFLELCSLLLDEGTDQFSRVSFYHSAAGVEARAAKSNQLNIQDDISKSMTKEFDENFPLNSSLNDSEMEEDLPPSPVPLQFPCSYPKVQNDSANTNGYVGTNASNGTRA